MKKITISAISVLVLATASFASINEKACTTCHGADWSKKALGKSKVVSEMSHEEIATALKGYKAGTFGGNMKGLMKGQLSKYSDEELEAFAKKIGK